MKLRRADVTSNEEKAVENFGVVPHQAECAVRRENSFKGNAGKLQGIEKAELKCYSPVRPEEFEFAMLLGPSSVTGAVSRNVKARPF